MAARKDDSGLESTAAQPIESTAAAPPLGETKRTQPPIERPLGTGTKVGKFILEERLGAGAMGVVYAARDPELERRVAIKLIKSRHGSEDLRTRLYREAQALARVAHPNVVVVHEVGEHAGQVFVAMELIKGDTLRAWVAAKKHTTDEILAILIAAGRGLSAAHAAELVHRDFKPDNVLVGTDGRARVTDFGLARGQGDPSEGELRGGSPVTSPLDAYLTQTGAMLGTPVYASPEQLAGERVGPASDQFSFCVTAYEAIYAQRPFAATTLEEQIAAVTKGKIEPAPGTRSVPARVHRAIVRGLSPKPEDRFPSMDALLAELGAPRRKARNIAIVAGLSCVLGGATALGVMATRSTPRPSCADEAAALDKVWTPEREAQLKAKLAGKPFAGQRLATDANVLRRYTSEWSTRRRDACTAARAGDAAAPKVVECLELRREDFAKTVEILATGPEVIDHLHMLLEPVWSCPSATRQPVRDARAARVRAEIAAMSGDTTALDDITSNVDKLPYPLLQAETLAILWEHAFLVRDDVHSDDYARRASVIAGSAGDERTKIVAGIAQARMLVRRDQLDSAERELGHATAALAHYGPEILLEARIGEARGDVLRARGKLEDAAKTYEVAFAILNALNLHGSDLPLADVYDKLGRAADAAALRAKFDSMPVPNQSGDLTARLRKCDEDFNAGEFERLIAQCESLAARKDLPAPMAAGLWQELALAHELKTDYTNGRRAYLAMAAIREAMGNTDRLASDLSAAARMAFELGDHATAIADYKRSIELASKLAVGDQLAKSRAGLGRSLVSAGQVADGIRELQWALPRLEVMKEPPRETIARARLALAEALWQRAGANDRVRARVTALSAQDIASEQHASLADQTGKLGVYIKATGDRLVKDVGDWLATHR